MNNPPEEEKQLENARYFLNPKTGDLLLTYYLSNIPDEENHKNWVEISKTVFDMVMQGVFQKPLEKLSWEELLGKAMEVNTFFYNKLVEKYGGGNKRTNILWEVVCLIEEEGWEGKDYELVERKTE